jgi:hypothetical protein
MLKYGLTVKTEKACRYASLKKVQPVELYKLLLYRVSPAKLNCMTSEELIEEAAASKGV